MKFIAGYERWNPETSEAESFYINRDVLRIFGYPYWGILINPFPSGTPMGEWTISLPQHIVNELNNNFGNDSILYGPGNMFGLYSCKNGLVQDGIKEIFVKIGEGAKQIYLMKTN